METAHDLLSNILILFWQKDLHVVKATSFTCTRTCTEKSVDFSGQHTYACRSENSTGLVQDPNQKKYSVHVGSDV